MYRTAYQLNPNSKWTVQHLAQTAFDAKNFELAQQYIDIILEDDEDNFPKPEEMPEFEAETAQIDAI